MERNFAIVLALILSSVHSHLALCQTYENEETRNLVTLVKDAAELLRTKGETAFDDFRSPTSRWQKGETYIFVINPNGNMLVHPDPELQGKNQLELKDINGKPIIRGLIDAAMDSPDRPYGWHHYEWPVAHGIFPRWKSSYVELVKAPSAKSYIVGSGVYNDRMERVFVVDMVQKAVAQIEKDGSAAFRIFHDPTSPFIAKDAYIFVLDQNGVELVNPAFPNLEGRNLMDLKDTQGKKVVREMFNALQPKGSGWVDYMWPKPGESVSTQKSTYVSRAKMGGNWVLVGCGVYLANAPKAKASEKILKTQELLNLVREGAAVLERNGDKAFEEFRQKGSKWFHNDTYFIVYTLDGTRVFHADNRALEGKNVHGAKDILGRNYGDMMLDAANSPKGEGWVHYMYPKPGEIFPTWKSTFVKRVTVPSGKSYVIGAGIYNMQMDKTLIEDVVNRAANLIAAKGKDAFGELRDKTGNFVFMDTYVFVEATDGTELMNAAVPSLEGRNLIDLKDAKGKAVAKDQIAAALKDGSAWMEVYWYKPGETKPARKMTFVRRVQSGKDTYVVGSGVYLDQ